MDQNTFTINKEKVNLTSFIKSIYERVLPAFKNKRIQLAIDCPADLFIDIDPTRFEQVLINLLDNSLKYSNETSTTTVRAVEENGKVHITIQDQGIGIPEDDLPHIFDRLYRVDKSRSRATGGFGLGLAIVKQLVEAHGGEVNIESQVGVGTRFTIILAQQKNSF